MHRQIAPKVPNDVGEIAEGGPGLFDLWDGCREIAISFFHGVGLKLAFPVYQNDFKIGPQPRPQPVLVQKRLVMGKFIAEFAVLLRFFDKQMCEFNSGLVGLTRCEGCGKDIGASVKTGCRIENLNSHGWLDFAHYRKERGQFAFEKLPREHGGSVFKIKVLPSFVRIGSKHEQAPG